MKSEIESPAPPALPPKLKKRKSGLQPHQLSHDERFWHLYLAAFEGLHAQFEFLDSYGVIHYEDGKAELERSQDLARRAWNSAIYGTAMFEDDEQAIAEFNAVVLEAEKAEEEEEEDELNERLA